MAAERPLALELAAVSPDVTVRPYGDGLLIDLPIAYSDGDGVRLYVEPASGTGFRVSDRGAAATLLGLAGVELADVSAGFTQIVQQCELNAVQDGELATTGTDLRRLVVAVAQASRRVEQLAVRRRRPTVLHPRAHLDCVACALILALDHLRLMGASSMRVATVAELQQRWEALKVARP